MLTRDASGRAVLGGIPVVETLGRVGVETPAYVYDLAAMADEARRLRAGFDAATHLVAYAVKANTAGPVVRALAAAGCGAEVGSRAELEVALGCGIPPERILFSGVGKTTTEIDRAIGTGDRGLYAVHVDAVDEIERIAQRARALGRRTRICLRVNPAVSADTHAHIATGHEEAKFGIATSDLDAAWAALDRTEALELVGVATHIGSQLTRTDEYLDSAARLIEVTRACEARSGRRLEMIDPGGGFGIDYGGGCPASPADFARGTVRLLREHGLADRTVVVEPGRALVGAHGVLAAAVIVAKLSAGRRFLVVDAGMNDLLRPALYGARHRVEPLERPVDGASRPWRVVGPVCESSDDFGDHVVCDPAPAAVIFRDAGAYGFTMASNYNGRGLPAEVFVHDDGRVTASTLGSASAWAEGRLSAG
jgi:diaminopimelate decarboxylase